MADLMRLGVVLDPTQTGQGASAIKKQLDDVNKSADKMQAGITAAAAKAGQSLTAAGKAGSSAGSTVASGASTASKGMDALDAVTRRVKSSLEAVGGMGDFLKRSLEFAIGGIIEKMIELSAEMAFMFPKEVITRGLEYNDTVAKATNQIAGMITATRPDLINNFSDALRIAGDVVKGLQDQVQKYHFSSLSQLNDMFTSVSTGTSTWGISLQHQIDIAGAMLAAFRAKNVDGQQASRDAIDVLMGRGEHVVAAKEIFQGGDLEKMNELIKQVESGMGGVDQLLAIIQKDTGAYAQASEHSLQILSVTWEALGQAIDKGLGGVTQGLYDSMVAQINRVRAVIGSADFAGALGPLVDILEKAVKLAGDLAVALATDPKDFMGVLGAGLNAVWASSIEFLVGQIPKIVPAFSDVFKTIAPGLFDLMFAAAAILTTAVQTVFAQIQAQYQLPVEQKSLDAYKAVYGTKYAGMTLMPHPDDYDAQVSARQAHIDLLQKQTMPSAGDFQNGAMAQYNQNKGIANGMANDVLNSMGLPSKTTIESATDAWKDYDTALAKVTATAALAKGKANDAQYGIPIIPNIGPAPRRTWLSAGGSDDVDRLSIDSRNATSGQLRDFDPSLLSSGAAHHQDPNKAYYVSQQDNKIDQDKYDILVAQGTANEKLIAQAEALLKIDEYRKSLLEHLPESKGSVPSSSLVDVDSMTQKFADAQNQVTAQALAQKTLTEQINAAEEVSAKAQAKVTEIQGDPFTTQLNKRGQLLDSYNAEIAALQTIITLDQNAINSGTIHDQAAIVQRQKEIDSASKQISSINNQKKLQSDSGEFQADMVNYVNKLGTMGTQTAGIITGTLDSALNSTSDNVMKLIDGTQTWGQTFQNIGQQILATLEQLIIKMLLTQALQSAMSGVGGSFFGGVPGAHSGGVYGVDPSTFTRSLPKYHTGGVAQDESLAVVKKDESILTPGQMRAISGAKGAPQAKSQNLHIHINNIAAADALTQISKNKDGLMNIMGSSRTQFRTSLGLPA